jgi:hypothetical protein
MSMAALFQDPARRTTGQVGGRRLFDPGLRLLLGVLVGLVAGELVDRPGPTAGGVVAGDAALVGCRFAAST